MVRSFNKQNNQCLCDWNCLYLSTPRVGGIKIISSIIVARQYSRRSRSCVEICSQLLSASHDHMLIMTALNRVGWWRDAQRHNNERGNAQIVVLCTPTRDPFVVVIATERELHLAFYFALRVAIREALLRHKYLCFVACFCDYYRPTTTKWFTTLRREGWDRGRYRDSGLRWSYIPSLYMIIRL